MLLPDSQLGAYKLDCTCELYVGETKKSFKVYVLKTTNKQLGLSSEATGLSRQLTWLIQLAISKNTYGRKDFNTRKVHESLEIQYMYIGTLDVESVNRDFFSHAWRKKDLMNER